MSACASSLWRVPFVGWNLALNRHVEKTGGTVVETYSKKTFVSRKQTADTEILVVKYTVRGTSYTGKTERRPGSSQDFVPVYYYRDLPSMAWYYRKDNPNLVYCSVLLFFALGAAAVTMPKKKR